MGACCSGPVTDDAVGLPTKAVDVQDGSLPVPEPEPAPPGDPSARGPESTTSLPVSPDEERISAEKEAAAKLEKEATEKAAALKKLNEKVKSNAGTPKAGAAKKPAPAKPAPAKAPVSPSKAVKDQAPKPDKKTTKQQLKEDEGFFSDDCETPVENFVADRKPSFMPVKLRTVTQCGVKLSYLVDFAKTIDASYTTSDVVTHIIFPRTSKYLCRFVDLVEPENVAAPKYFISHRWGSPFHDLVKLLVQHVEADAETEELKQEAYETVVWLDIFAINQHPGVDQKDDLDQLHRVIFKAGKTLLCLDKQGLVLTRIWCLYEIWQTVESKTAAGLHILSYDVDVGAVRDIFHKLDVAQAQATVLEDRDKILVQIEQSVGIQNLTQVIKRALVDSTSYEAESSKKLENKQPERYALALLKNAIMQHLAGKYADAEPLYRKALVITRQELGENDPRTAACTNSLALLLRDQGRYKEAEPLCRQALLIKERTLGPEHNSTAVSMMTLAGVLQQQGNFMEAESLARKVLHTMERIFGPNHADTAASLNGLAAMLQAQRRYDEAEPFLRRALSIRTTVLGADHPETGSTQLMLGNLLVAKGKPREAEKLLRQALAVRRHALGEHPDTAVVLQVLGEVLAERKLNKEAEGLLREASDMRSTVLGAGHPDRITSLHALAEVLRAQGSMAEAESLLRLSLQLISAKKGMDSPDLCETLNKLAAVLKASGKAKEGDEMLRRSIRLAPTLNLQSILGTSALLSGHFDGSSTFTSSLGGFKSGSGLMTSTTSLNKSGHSALKAAVAKAVAGSSQGSNTNAWNKARNLYAVAGALGKSTKALSGTATSSNGMAQTAAAALAATGQNNRMSEPAIPGSPRASGKLALAAKSSRQSGGFAELAASAVAISNSPRASLDAQGETTTPRTPKLGGGAKGLGAVPQFPSGQTRVGTAQGGLRSIVAAAKAAKAAEPTSGNLLLMKTSSTVGKGKAPAASGKASDWGLKSGGGSGMSKSASVAVKPAKTVGGFGKASDWAMTSQGGGSTITKSPTVARPKAIAKTASTVGQGAKSKSATH